MSIIPAYLFSKKAKFQIGGKTINFLSGNPSILVGLMRLSLAETRSISPENFTGEKGKGGMAVEGPASAAARDLGAGWKISPYVVIQPGETFTLADIEDMGAIQHIWMTSTGNWRRIVRIYWGDQEHSSVEYPVGDFFRL